MKRKKDEDLHQNYLIYYGDFSKENLGALIDHCDQKIENFFRELIKRHIPRLIRAELKRNQSRRKKVAR